MKKNDIVEYLGCSQEQINWGNNDDPRSFLIVGKEYTIEKVDVHSQHTKIKLYNKMGWFNSVCFEVKSSELNSPLEYRKNMDPSDIQLENPSKMFEYEKSSREIDACDDVATLKLMCKCYVKLHLKQQETLTNILKYESKSW
tara:strand:- start:75 stop:500 length:426 start_codon:yes stop_codon:yes gene_type:complete